MNIEPIYLLKTNELKNENKAYGKCIRCTI